MACKTKPFSGPLALCNKESSDPLFFALPTIVAVADFEKYSAKLDLMGTTSVDLEVRVQAIYSNDTSTWVIGTDNTGGFVTGDGVSFSGLLTPDASYQWMRVGVEVKGTTFAQGAAILSVFFQS